MLKYGYLYWYCHTKTLLSWLPQIGFKRILIKSKAYILKFINKLVEKFGPDLLLLFFLLSGYLPVTLKLSAFFPHVHLHKPIGLSESFVTSYLAVFVYIFSVQIYIRSVGKYFRVSYLRQPSCCSSHSWKKKKKSVWLFVTPWTTAHQASLPFTISQSLLKLMSIELVMPSSHLILCHLLLLMPSILPSIGVFSNESALHIRWPKYWGFSFSISPSNECSVLISFRIDWFDLHAVQGTPKSLL